MARINDINITEGQIAYSNFSGRPTQFNPEGGSRNVTFVIPEDIAEGLIEEGWRVRRQEFDDGTYRYLLEASFLFRTRNGQPRDPKIFIVQDNRLIHVTEETADALDRADIVSVDAVISPSYWEYAGRSGIKAYINSMYITIKENPIDAKYRRMLEESEAEVPEVPDISDTDDLPFPIE